MKNLIEYNKISDIRNFIKECKSQGKIIGLIPTMGSLHSGHLSLIQNAKMQSDIVVVSIFVNKAQFNDNKDYDLYPRELQRDREMLATIGVDCLFAPPHDEIYNADFSFKILVNAMTNCLCASYRENHFDGVALIVTKLFNIVAPDFAYFGEKDFQQLAIIKKLTKDLNFNIKIISSPTIREESGLAMSSRNQRLSSSARLKAHLIYKALKQIKNNPTTQQIEQEKQKLLENGFEKIDYLEIRNEDNLELNMNLNSLEKRRIFIATYLEGVRLIDNLVL